MRSETIFKYTTYWRGRYGDQHGREIVVSSCFDNPGQWPFTVRFYDIDIESFPYRENKEETEAIRISAEIFEEIKRYIDGNSALRGCAENIGNDVMDGSRQSFYFACGSYSKSVGGLSILGTGAYEASTPGATHTANYTVYAATEAIKAILAKIGVNLIF